MFCFILFIFLCCKYCVWPCFLTHTFGHFCFESCFQSKTSVDQGTRFNLLAFSIACVLLFTSSFSKRFWLCVFTVLIETKSRLAISWLLFPSAIKPSICSSRP